MSLQINPFKKIPDETIVHIFSYLGLKELMNCSEIDRRLYMISKDESLWKALFPEVKVPKGHKVRDYVVFSEDELVKNVSQFVKKIQLDQTGRIIFYANHNSQPKFIITLSDGIKPLDVGTPPTIEKTVLIAKKIPRLWYSDYVSTNTTNPLYYNMEGKHASLYLSTTWKIEHVLKTRFSELFKQKLSQYLYYGTAAVVALMGVGIQTYLK